MAVTVNIYYRGNGGNARRFVREMVESGIVAKIRAKDGNLRYEYFFPMEDEENWPFSLTVGKTSLPLTNITLLR